MAQMPATIGAMHFRPYHEKCPINLRAHSTFQRGVEGWPARTAFILGRGIKQSLAAPSAMEMPRALFVIERRRTRSFGAMLAQDAVGFGRKARTPFCIRALKGKAFVLNENLKFNL